jgi:hypothetical protein
MTDAELSKLGYKRYSDGSIRDSQGHFAGNSGTIPGTPGVDAAETYLTNANYTIDGREISVRGADGTLRRYDIVATSPDGTVIGIEVKSGSATRTAQQIAIDTELIGSGGLNTVGQKAVDANISRISDVKVIHVDKKGNITIK